MKFNAQIFPKVLIAFAAWVGIILAIGKLLRGSETSNVAIGLSSRVQWGVVAAALFGLGCIALWRIWKETGFTKPAKDAAWWLLALPVAFIAMFITFGLSQGSLSNTAILIVLVNSLIVGLNEEVMLRGLIFSGTADRFSFLTACIFTTLLFAGMHMLNFFSTGEIPVLQTLTTIGSGLMLLAIRVGMGSIIPAIIIHGLWDFGTALTGLVEDFSEVGILGIVPLFIIAAPFIFAIIGGVYLWRYSKRLTLEEAA